jgi:hypothetical protein
VPPRHTAESRILRSRIAGRRAAGGEGEGEARGAARVSRDAPRRKNGKYHSCVVPRFLFALSLSLSLSLSVHKFLFILPRCSTCCRGPPPTMASIVRPLSRGVDKSNPLIISSSSLSSAFLGFAYARMPSSVCSSHPWATTADDDGRFLHSRQLAPGRAKRSPEDRRLRIPSNI